MKLPSAKQDKVDHYYSKGYLHFLQFVMYFHQLGKLEHVKDFTFQNKKRKLVHLLAINGHTYLFKAAIAVLGINRQKTSLNVNDVDEDNSSALLLSIKQKRFELVKYLMRFPKIQSNIYSIKFGLPLHVAL